MYKDNARKLILSFKHGDRIDLARHPQRARQRTPVGGNDRSLSRGVDLGKNQRIDSAELAYEIFEQVTRSLG